MGKIIDTIIGDLGEKKRYRAIEKRAKALPVEYRRSYTDIKHYLWNTSGILSMEPLASLVEMLEAATAEHRNIVDITGPDVAAFADELVRGEKTYFDRRREKLNKSVAKKS